MSPDRDIGPGREEWAAALRDPIRRRILFLLGDRPQGVSIRQLAIRLGEPPRRIRHYVEILVEAGQVVVEGQRPRRNTIEKTFRARSIPLLWKDDWPGGIDLAETKRIVLDILRLTFDDVTAAISDGSFAEREGWCAVRTWREVDAQGWEELVGIHERAVVEILAAVDRAAERLAGGEADPIPAISALFLLEALPWQE
jgi:DNA-binding transcriptional ArsR family regulator